MRWMRAAVTLVLGSALIAGCSPFQSPAEQSPNPEPADQQTPAPPTAPSTPPSGERGEGLVWSAEFDGGDGEPLDEAEWSIAHRGDGYGNEELQVYTPRTENVYQDGQGVLRLIAREESAVDPRGFEGDYTSGRIETTTRFQYGRVEARINAPIGVGLWPAFWLYGDSLDGEQWPAVGEIDIVELISHSLELHNSVIAATESGERWIRNSTSEIGEPWGGQWRVYAVEWEEEHIAFFVDDEETFRVERTDLEAHEEWPFDRPYSITLNLAVGGWADVPTEETVLPAEMLVDYVRVYDSEVVPGS